MCNRMASLDRLRASIRDLPVGNVLIDLEFHRIGEEVVAVPTKHVDGGVRVLAHL
jgi:hypothetical protein